MYRAYLTVRDAQGARLGADRLHRLRAHPSLTRDLYAVSVASHVGNPVIRIEERDAPTFRATYRDTRAAIESFDYGIAADLTAAARRALRS